MRIVTLTIFLVLCFSYGALADADPATASDPPTPAEAASIVESDNFERVALSLLQIDTASTEGTICNQDSFLRYLDQQTSVQVVGGAFQAVFSDEEAGQLADFLSSDTGQAGIGIFSRWLLRGEFLKNPVPQDLATTWETFRATTAGIKLFAEVYDLYREIAIQAVEIGGKLVVKAISSDIGKGAAVSLLGALVKSGTFFL